VSKTIHKVGQTPATYDYVKVKDVLDVPETYIHLATLDIPYREVGTYEFKIAMLRKLNLANKSIFFRYRFNGGIWQEIISEPKDRTDKVPADYFYPLEWDGGVVVVDFEIRKEDTNGTLDVFFFDAVFERKG